MNKQYITAQKLLNDSFELAIKIAEEGYSPNLIVGVWRGGTPVGIAIQEALAFIGLESDHIAIRTSSYEGISSRKNITVHGLEYIQKNIISKGSMLIVDDVYDTGLSLEHVINELENIFKENMPELKIATPYYKPENNKTKREPDFYLHSTNNWLVFPHELLGLSDDEILKEKPGIEIIKKRLIALRK